MHLVDEWELIALIGKFVSRYERISLFLDLGFKPWLLSWLSQRLEKALSGRNNNGQIGKMKKKMGISAAIGERVKFLAAWSFGKSPADLGAT